MGGIVLDLFPPKQNMKVQTYVLLMPVLCIYYLVMIWDSLYLFFSSKVKASIEMRKKVVGEKFRVSSSSHLSTTTTIVYYVTSEKKVCRGRISRLTESEKKTL